MLPEVQSLPDKEENVSKQPLYPHVPKGDEKPKLPQLGGELRDGNILIASNPEIRPSIVGEREGYIVLELNPKKGEYVTHWMSVEDGATFWGHYFMNFEDAANDYLKR